MAYVILQVPPFYRCRAFCGSRRFHGLCMLALVTHPDYDIPLPDGHRFPATKFSKLIASLHDQGLFGHFTPVTPTAATPDDLGLVHCPDYIAAIAEGRLPEEALRVLGLKWSSVLRNRSFLAVNGTMLAARHALSHGLACHAAGGTHHAHFDYGAGFCVFNDLAFTARRLNAEGAVRSVLILDCDVHQGDGTARILADDTAIFTCSLHCRNNYPARKATSDLDIEIEPGTGDDDYLRIVEMVLKRLAEDESCQPDLVLYDAGVDVHTDDRLGNLALSHDGILARDKMVIQHFRGRHIPIATVIGGGYGHDIDEVAYRHSLVFRAAHASTSAGKG